MYTYAVKIVTDEGYNFVIEKEKYLLFKTSYILTIDKVRLYLNPNTYFFVKL